MSDPNGNKKLNHLTYPPLGKCIYCGVTQNLEAEHILPFGLSGTAILPKSTCRACAQITGQCEQEVLRGPMWAVRIYRDLKSRTKHKDAPAEYPVKISKDGREFDLLLPIEEVPILLPFPLFALPAFFSPAEYEHGISVKGVITISFGITPEETARKLGAEKIILNQNIQPVAFARMIAKIAFAWAAAEGKLRFLKKASPVVPAILGRVDDIGRWVGTTEASAKYSGILHRLLIHEDRINGVLIGEVQLFSDSQTPSYNVVLGELQ